MNIENYHFHLYYETPDFEKASKLREVLEEAFKVEAGRLWDRPVGPHPVGSCQFTVTTELFQEVIVWLLANRNGLDFFIHPVTGDDLANHSEHIMWIGKSYDLNLDLFK